MFRALCAKILRYKYIKLCSVDKTNSSVEVLGLLTCRTHVHIYVTVIFYQNGYYHCTVKIPSFVISPVIVSAPSDVGFRQIRFVVSFYQCTISRVR